MIRPRLRAIRPCIRVIRPRLLSVRPRRILSMRPQITLPYRIIQPQIPVLPAHIQLQRLAIPALVVRAVILQLYRRVRAPNQPIPLKPRVIPPAVSRVKPPVLAHPIRRVPRALRVLIPLRRVNRRHLQYKLRRPRLRPHLIPVLRVYAIRIAVPRHHQIRYQHPLADARRPPQRYFAAHISGIRIAQIAYQRRDGRLAVYVLSVLHIVSWRKFGELSQLFPRSISVGDADSPSSLLSNLSSHCEPL